jgi:phosphoribosyl-ATP pyrophosphohydrolase
MVIKVALGKHFDKSIYQSINIMELNAIYLMIQDRIKKLPKGSRVAQMYKEGLDRIIQKVGEEAVEVVIAAKGKDRQRIIEETADLWFMTLVLLAAKKIKLSDIFDEFKSRR